MDVHDDHCPRARQPLLNVVVILGRTQLVHFTCTHSSINAQIKSRSHDSWLYAHRNAIRITRTDAVDAHDVRHAFKRVEEEGDTPVLAKVRDRLAA